MSTKKILIRAGKDPRVPMTAYETFSTNPIGNNNGNLIFATAAHKLLSASEQQVDVHGLAFHPRHAARVNEEYDHVVLPLANAFRRGFEAQLKNLTLFVEKLNIPVTMLSGGAQSGPDGSFDNLLPMKSTAQRFCAAVLERSPKLTVRGERTAEYLRSIGVRDVEVIGCPSVTLNGRGHRVDVDFSRAVKKVAYNVETSKDLAGSLVESVEANCDAHYFAQDMKTFELMLHGTEAFPHGRDGRLPLRSSHSQFTAGKARFPLDAWTWIEELRGYDFAFGPRIHGNVTSVLAGTPALLFAHDSRTRELAEYHGIPHLTESQYQNVSSLDDLLEKVDYSEFNARHGDNFDRLISFVHESGLSTIYDEGEERALESYRRSVDAVTFPPSLTTTWADQPEFVRHRFAHERELELELKRLRASMSEMKAEVKRLKENVAAAV